MEKSTLRRADLLFSVAIMVGSVLYMFESIKIFVNPFKRKWENVPSESLKETLTFWYKSPALMPFVVSFLLFVCALVLFHIAKKDGARLDFLNKNKIMEFIRNQEFKSFILITLFLCIYVFLFIPVCRYYLNIFIGFYGFPFFVATFLYLTSMMVVFGKKKVKHVLKSVLVSIIASGLVTYAFGTLAQIPLP